MKTDSSTWSMPPKKPLASESGVRVGVVGNSGQALSREVLAPKLSFSVPRGLGRDVTPPTPGRGRQPAYHTLGQSY